MALRADDVDLGRDRDLVQRYQNGDPQAFDDLYRRYFGRLHRFCRRRTRDHHEAEEVAQEAFVKALRSMHSLRGEQRFYPWMTVIARRITIDRHRKHSRLELTDEPDMGSVEPEIDHLFDAVDADHVRTALANLGPRHRDVLHLRETQGLSYAEIATHLEVPTTTVEALLHRARKALRREYAKVSGDAGGFASLPIFGILGTRLGAWRDRLGERWAELAAVAAPAAVAAVTAAVVMTPGASPPPEVAAPAPSAVVAEVAPAENAAGQGQLELRVPAPPPTRAQDRSVTDGPAPAPPTHEVGPVDVFTGPDGHRRAAEETERQPVNVDVGPADAGADPPMTVEDVVAFVADAARFLRGDEPSDTTTTTDTSPTLLGGR